MVERCVRCRVRSDKIRLYDAIYEGRMSLICERCSIIENVPIIRKPDSEQLKDSEEGEEVYKRMRRIKGLEKSDGESSFFREDRLNELNANPELELPENEKLRLIDHFNWEIMKLRRRKGLSQKQLAENISESEIVIQMIEKGKFPENMENIVKKLEQFFQLRFRKISEIEKIMKLKERQKKDPVLLDEDGNELEVIPEPEVVCETIDKKDKKTPLLEGVSVTECRLEVPENKNYKQKQKSETELIKKPEVNIDDLDEDDELDLEEFEELDLKKQDFTRTTIKDLQGIHKKKLEVTRQEKIQEQKMIEERNKIVEARKEELRQQKEKQSSDIDEYLGGSELLGGGKLKKDDYDLKKDFDREL